MATSLSVDVSLVTEAFLGALVAHFEPKGIRVGDHEAPYPVGNADLPGRASPYLKVYRTVAGAPNRDESWTGNTTAMKWVRHQVVAAAQERKMADRACQEAVDVLLGTTAWFVQEPEVSGGPRPAPWSVPLADKGIKVMRVSDDGQVPIETSGSIQVGGLVGMLVGLV